MRSKWIPSYSLVMFAGRAALAATLALVCSLLLGLHEPHWAAWTAVSVGLPARGDGLLKSLNRAIGTAIGAPTGVLLAFAAHGSEPLLVGLLAAWLAVSVYAGLSLRHYRAYAAVLAGYSAVIIAMSLTDQTGQLFEVGRDRCAGIFIGIASTLLVLLLSRDVQSGHASRRIRRAIATACTWSADRLVGLPRAWAADGTGPQRLRSQLSDILALDGAVHSAVAESPALWARAGRLHKIVPALLDLLVVSRSVERNFEEAAATNNPISEEVEVVVVKASVLLTSIAVALTDDPAHDIEKLPGFRLQAQALRGMLVSIQARNAIERRRIDLVSALLGATETALRTYAALTGEQGGVDTESYPPPVYALDHSYAIAAALRAGFALLLAGAIWIATGWQGGPLFVAFTAIAIALFAIRPDPRDTGRHFLASGAVGAGAAFLFYATVSPHLPHAIGVSLAEGGIVFLGIVVASALSNAFWASGFCLVFLVVSDPESIAHTTTAAISAHALGVLAGSALAALAFHLVPSRRLEQQWRKQRLKRIADAIRALIASPVAQQTVEMRHAWQCRSIDTLVRLALPAASVKEVDECMAWIEIGGELLKLKEASRVEPLPLSARKSIDDLLTDLQSLELQSWHVRLIVADAELRDEKLAGNQHVLGTRAVVLELASLIQRIAAAESCANGAEYQLKSRSNTVWQ
ncbi:FUSC family protein [Paraburkholderia sp. NPDC080076]|uniref:FUSC family protein n=1 Tax=Paraburkholderia sp. NPDC080076 TaxID=3390605 RepID=UPI003D087DA3